MAGSTLLSPHPGLTDAVEELGGRAEVVRQDDLVEAKLHTRLFACEADDVRRLGTREPADDPAGAARGKIAVTIEEPNGVVPAKPDAR